MRTSIMSNYITMSWLVELSKKYGTDFVKRYGDKKTTTGRTVRMFCSRSGSTVNKSKLTQTGKIPRLSVRCGKDCTAFLVAHVTSSKVSVEYCLQHAAHVIEAEEGKWMRLSSEQREWVISLLRDSRNADYILDQIARRENVAPYDRLQYLSRRDIYDFDRRCNACNFRLDRDDLTSVRIRSEQDENLHGFKEPADETGEGFCLIIGTKYQEELLWRYGREAICLDSTHNVTKYSLKLVTVLVFTEAGVARAVGHCLCYQESAKDMLPFFRWIRERMNGIKEAFGSASSETQHILCAWHVKRAWSRRLEIDVKDPEKRAVVKDCLNKIPREKNQMKLDDLISQMLTYLWNSDLKNYAAYFSTNYLTDERVKKWAAPYREGTVVNCNMGLERFHLLLKDDYLKFRQNKRIDELVDLLIKYSGDASRKDKYMVRGSTTGRYRLQVSHANHKSAEAKLQESGRVQNQADGSFIVFSSSTSSGRNVTFFELCSCLDRDSGYECFNWIKGFKGDFESAKKACVKSGGQMASFHQDDSNSDLSSFGLDPLWLGGQDTHNNGTWTWVDGKRFDYTAWAAGEPSNIAGRNCLQGDPVTETWRAASCDEQRNVVCEYKFTPPTIPTNPPKCWDNFCYKFGNALVDWATAEKNCQAMKGHLASIHSKNDEYNIQMLAESVGIDQFWIGATISMSDQPVWSDGSAFNYTNWDANMAPTHETGRCVQDDLVNWFNMPCSYTAQTLCEIPASQM
ncbi:hypothetical protein QR680_018187 [Steinernema hermaphroditum]|uniref:C-type lectin domain-containing protein n=1 Tax=Steinernema hermaphroditum TaxID=289476 RepID=A0AA39HH52_9BILA|nr:hypothetical protein QR680_018187 [Steinernema hermaphroditum]